MIQWKRLSQWMKMHPISSPIRVKRILHYGLDRDRVGHHDPREQLRVTSLYFFFLHPIFVCFFFKLNFLPENKKHLKTRSSAEWKCSALITAASLADNFCVFPLIKFLVSFEGVGCSTHWTWGFFVVSYFSPLLFLLLPSVLHRNHRVSQTVYCVRIYDES